MKKRKSGEELKLRLVCDLRQLNKNVRRSGSSIPTSLEIWKRLNHDSRFFFVCDIAQAYHQCQISSKDEDLFAFTLPQGVYYYKRAPMGFCGSGDHMVQVTDKILENLENLNKEVDDCLLEAKDKEDMLRVLSPFLERCRQNGIFLSKTKIEVGEEVS